MTTGLIIAGHGSHLSAGTAAPAWQHADQIRAMGVFDEVTCAFWKESPSLHRVLETLTADDITIVPLFTSTGYFSGTLLPAELGLTGSLTQRDGRTIRYTNTVGEHPRMTEIIWERALSTLASYDFDPAQTALAIAGHGTARDRKSALATAAQAEAIRARGKFAEVLAVYMEEPPEIAQIYTLTHSQNIIVVPFFVADGSHSQEDIPKLLRLGDDPRYPVEVQGRRVCYTSAIGMEPSVANVILELAVAAGATLKPPQPIRNTWAGFPLAGLAELRKIPDPFPYGDLLIERDESQFLISCGENHEKLIETPSALRAWVIKDANGNFRPLRTGKDLVRGWCVVVDDVESLLGVIETVYPGLWIDVVQHQAGKLDIQSLEQTAARQVGIYKQVGTLAHTTQLPELIHAHCGACVRQPTWYRANDINALPCPEACQPFMTFAMHYLESTESDQPTELFEFTGDEVASLRAALDYAMLYPAEDVRPGEFDDPRNPARLRLLRMQIMGDLELELPFTLETDLERQICADPKWQKGANWGKPRPGHLEGKVIYHIAEVLRNIDHNATTSEEREKLRLIAIIHDTFKYRVDNALPRTPENDHAIFARQFAETYIHDPAILTVIASHDEAYHCWRYGYYRNDWAAANQLVDQFIARLGEALPLYTRFFRSDNQTQSKDQTPLLWFEEYLQTHGISI